ncbi:protein phosphatase 2C domain-containing protein [Streptomyces lateritius]|uniref:protein phosphatase 2C domain-containing protein n=1 Tax=Streptomyces lateritius TaxID=67313 RepID=UPI0016756C68|nr:protein phosphatase 2C domain-containing protein [Streptomyces lateritius]
MTQQGDSWWDKLYDESAPDTAPTATGDTLEDRFDSASRAMPAAVRRDSAPPRPERPPWEPLDTEEEAGDPRPFPPPPDAPPPPPASPAAAVPSAPPAPPEPPPPPPPAPPRSSAPALETQQADTAAVPRPRTGHIGSRPPTYEAEPTALPAARPGELADLVADTVLDGARYGACTVRAASLRGDSARYRGEPRRDTLLTARFGQDEAALVLVAVATGARASEGAHLAAAEACRWIGDAVGRSHARLSEDIRAGRRGDLKSGLHRLTDRTYGKLRARAAERGLEPEEYTASLRCLLLSADPGCRTRVFFGIGRGGLFRLRDGAWQDIEPLVPERSALRGAPVLGFGSPPPDTPAETEEGDRLTMDLGITTPAGPFVEDPHSASGGRDPHLASLAPPAEPFRFRASVARPGDTLLLASEGLAEPMRGEPALARELAERWAGAEPPGLAAFLADVQLRVKGYADDRTAVAVWEA